MPLRLGRAADTEPNKKEPKIMKAWRLNPGYRARRILAGAVVGTYTLIASPATVLAAFFTCTAAEVAVFPGSRIHVRCDPGDGAINYFALGVGNPDTSRVLSLATTAVAARRPLVILYDPNDLSGGAVGCLNINCRLIQGIFLNRD
jgi:hypothetical protein